MILTADASSIADEDVIPQDANGNNEFMYQWLRDGEDIPGATNSTYMVQPDDVGAAISVRVSFTDNERQYEMITSAETSTIAGSPGEISRIEPAIRSVTVSAGDTVTLSVDVYGLQNAKDNSLSGTFEWDPAGGSIDDGEGTREITYTAPSSPGSYDVTVSLNGLYCQPDVGDDETEAEAREADCNATIVVNVRRESVGPPPTDPPQNPPGEIPSILTDADGNQYEVFTPEEGGTFSGEGYSLNAGRGRYPQRRVHRYPDVRRRLGLERRHDAPALHARWQHVRGQRGRRQQRRNLGLPAECSRYGLSPAAGRAEN